MKISADDTYVVPNKDTVIVSVQVDDPTGLHFSAEIESPDENPVEFINLYDDGFHADSLAGDGIFSNFFLPTKEENYSVDLKLKLDGNDNLRFELNNAGSFTTVGPVMLDDIIFLKNPSPNPGDTVEIKLV